VRSARPYRLEEFVPLEDELHFTVYRALRVLLPDDAVLNTWELRNAVSMVEGARRKRLGALPGWPDMGVFYRGRVALLELKRRRYGRLSEAQAALHPRLAAAGFPVTVCRTADEALAAVAACGVPLRGRCAA
jgi:hypothetical protein